MQSGVGGLMMTDGDLVVLARDGDGGAAMVLYRRHDPRLQRRSRRWSCWDTSRAEDLVAMTWKRAWRSLAQFDVARPMPPWRFSILDDVARETYRRRGGSAPSEVVSDPDWLERPVGTGPGDVVGPKLAVQAALDALAAGCLGCRVERRSVV